MQINKQQVGHRIHELRITANLSMAELASAVGLAGKSTINDWEKGRTLANAERMEKLAVFFKVPVNYIRYGSLTDYVTTVFKETGLNHSEFNVLLWEFVDLTTTNPDVLSSDVFTPTAHSEQDQLQQTKIATALITPTINYAINQIVPAVVRHFESDSSTYPEPDEVIQAGCYVYRHRIQIVRRTFTGKYNRIVRLLDNVDLYEKLQPDDDYKRYLNQTTTPQKNTSNGFSLDEKYQIQMNKLITDFHQQLNKINAAYQAELAALEQSGPKSAAN
ncbi:MULTISPECIES: helix-turn-helix domain-containing protein [Lactiplantibacillus]|uniref:Helix-turn-helix transcriptional regulator n=1 Tax=Lactiplantibacillus pentosus TaxID=1589 RepID=A0AAW8VV52_LACPE|nr:MULTISPECIES: helix-turn-helix transcriptional regulator [Lactiplantibacillus]ASG80391.1 transcriptional regulator [Lactiplantibacillus pentosus]MBU7447294.1 helix-turn-helix transcriptional regulator [Lactiplantibacillus sp. 7.2.4]MBU7474706.1 helix-turn-helix transcriptional regulator [Lactiplantibacillus pentosus]MBU7479286.1 helix-turn-helix transcriptional regulator [Lactiplantibacillus pentosus]MBU7530022.1 helix-turn-helix transcriptional regulator [Lactiplantibacillus pentosus]